MDRGLDIKAEIKELGVGRYPRKIPGTNFIKKSEEEQKDILLVKCCP